MHYLRSRYFCSHIGRFLNEDALLAVFPTLLKHNLYSYCNNNTTRYHDSDGFDPDLAAQLDDNVEVSPTDKEIGGSCSSSSVQAFGSSTPTISTTAVGGGSSSTGSGATGNNTLAGSASNQTSYFGGPHGQSKPHRNIIAAMIDFLGNTGQYVRIYANCALKTAGLSGSQKPDIIAIPRDGNAEIWEIASPSQTYGSPAYWTLQDKMDLMHSNNPGVTIHFVPFGGD